MGKRLTENLSSLYIGAANNLKPKHAKGRLWRMWRAMTTYRSGVPCSLSMKTTRFISKSCFHHKARLPREKDRTHEPVGKTTW